MATDKIRIKDIARLSGVSVGTVDRVLHDRPNVSKTAREKVEKALKEMDYRPNAYASALAYNKTYNFYCIIPKHESEAYWEEIEEGAMSACERRRDFHVNVKMMYYKRFNNDTFRQVTEQCIKEEPDGVIVVPSTLDATRKFTDELHYRDIPFILLDSYMPDLKPLSFYGQDSFCSGYFAGRMLMLIASQEKEIMLMKQMKNSYVAS
ncbi:MAG: LacI family transcriptional regulator, partial [Prevotella sp.]|nr:LacI family transcriptional regulator [Prevotella sp.]